MGTGTLIKNRSDAARCPGPAHLRGHYKPAFIYENQPGVQLPGFFLMAGQVARTQVFMVFHHVPWRGVPVFVESTPGSAEACLYGRHDS